MVYLDHRPRNSATQAATCESASSAAHFLYFLDQYPDIMLLFEIYLVEY